MFVHIATTEVNEGIPPITDQTTCDKCTRDLMCGYGLAGGGFGPYLYCEEHGIVAKDNEDLEGE